MNAALFFVKWEFIGEFEAPHQRPPCVKGAVICDANDWGIDGKMLRIRRKLIDLYRFFCVNPSVCPTGSQLPLHKGAF